MRKLSMLSVMALLMVGLLMVACSRDDERITSYDASNAITYNASYSDDTYQEANTLALELTGYSYGEIKDFRYASKDKDAFEEPECTEATMEPGGHWYCWVLLMGCLMGCDQNHGGAICEQVCFNSYNSCQGTAIRSVATD